MNKLKTELEKLYQRLTTEPSPMVRNDLHWRIHAIQIELNGLEDQFQKLFKSIGLDLKADPVLNLAHAKSLVKYLELTDDQINLINKGFE